MSLSALSTLDVVESFFGEQLSDSVIDAVTRLPTYKAKELKNQIDARYVEVDDALMTRISFGLDRLPHDLFMQVATYVELELQERVRIQRAGAPFSTLKATTSADHAYLRRGEIHVHEAPLLDAGRRTGFADLDVLKHLALYCERVLIRDPLPAGRYVYFRGGEYSSDWLDCFAQSLRQILPIADLVRSGCFILGRCDVEFTGGGHASLLESVSRATLIEQYLDQFLVELTAAEGGPLIPTPELDISDELRASLEWTRAHAFIVQCIALALTPITSNPSILRFLKAYSSEFHQTTDMLADPRWAPVPDPVMAYRIPSLHDTPFDDVVRWRRDDEAFAEFRSALASLGTVCAEASWPGTYRSHRAAVRIYAEDIVRPTYERLKARLRSSAGVTFADAGMVLGLDALPFRESGCAVLKSILPR